MTSPFSTELQDAAKNLVSKDPKQKTDGIRQVVTLFAQGENSQSISMHSIAPYPDDNISTHRLANIVNRTYANDNPAAIPQIITQIETDFSRNIPLIQAIAVKQAGIFAYGEYAQRLIPLIIESSKSNDPYVRKTAALSILRVFENDSNLIESFNLAPVLESLIEDSNSNVASNAVATLVEINNSRSVPLLTPTIEITNNLLTTIEEATEWSQIQILEFVSNVVPASIEEAQGIIHRISTRLIQANPAVTISAFKCCLRMTMIINQNDFTKEVFAKIMPPLVALLNNGKEIQYTTLKSISVLLQKYHRLLSSDINIFFCKFDDPLYIKLEKLDIILTLTTDQNINRVLDELTNYAQDKTDVEFVRKSIRAIGRLALVFDAFAKVCVDTLVNLIQSKIHFIVQECIVVSVNIFRRYPNQYESIISTICQCLTGTLDDHRAKAALVWILGEYSTMITNAAELMDGLFLDDFLQEPTDVQLSILTAVVKFFLANQEDGQNMLQHVLSLATNEVDNPDLKDRAYMYLCLLTECSDHALDIVMSVDSSELIIDLQILEPKLVDTLVPMIGSLSCIYGKYPQEFVPAKVVQQSIQSPQPIATQNAQQPEVPAKILNDKPKIATGLPESDQLGMEEEEEDSGPPLLLESSNTSFEAEIRGFFEVSGGDRVFITQITNNSDQPFTFQRYLFNKNIFGFAIEDNERTIEIAPGSVELINSNVIINPISQNGAVPNNFIEVALTLDRPSPILFKCPLTLDFILKTAEEGAKLNKEEFMSTISEIPDSEVVESTFTSDYIQSIETAKVQLPHHRLYFIARKDVSCFFSAKTLNNDVMIFIFTFYPNKQCQVSLRTKNKYITNIVMTLISRLLS